MANLLRRAYNPDVLTCLANLSNDEVFTPPELANQVLDLLPKELWSDPSVKILDPFCKSGVFLREAAKRFIKGLEPVYPDLQERVDHIMHEQLFGIAITELTSLLSRRSLYCSKFPNGRFSVSEFGGEEGNIRYRNIQHRWSGGKCVYCGALEKVFRRDPSLESYAYEFIHVRNPETLFGMKFDVIIGNPPYQMSFGLEGGNSANSKSIYNLFVSQALSLNPRYLCMITPSRWMTKTAQGIPESWTDSMLKDHHFEVIHDFPDASACFPGVEVKGGVSYFLWNRSYSGKCHYYYHEPNGAKINERIDYLDSLNAGIVIRDPRAISIIQKIAAVEGEYYINPDNNFSGLVSPKHFFDDGKVLTSNWRGYASEPDTEHAIKYVISKSVTGSSSGWISEEQVPKHHEVIPLHKVYIPAAGGSGTDSQVLGHPVFGEVNSVCSQTYLVIGYRPEKALSSETECRNVMSYISTRLFRFLVSVKKKTQNGPRGVYQFVPLQDFTRSWSDEELYEKYKLSSDDIALIEETISPMDLEG